MRKKLPVVAIVGRPNVGKSTLFNRLVGKRVALVDDQPGVTRDRREGEGRLYDLEFVVFDTAGFEDADPTSLPGRMRAQTEAALGEADVALFLIDARAGLTEQDKTIAEYLRVQSRPVIVVANKSEGHAGDAGLFESYALGLGEPVALSAEHGTGLSELYDEVRVYLDPLIASAKAEEEALVEEEGALEGEEPEGPLKLAIVGRPNAGKSTLINRLLGEHRLITGPEAGITRDSISIDWEYEGRPVRLIDTAGLRRKAKVQEKLEKLSAADTRHAVDFAEVVVLLLDSTLGLEAQDLRIADMVLTEGRALIIALNKWDVAVDQSALFHGVRAALEDGLAQVRGVPLIAVSGKTGKGLDTLIEAAFESRADWSRRVSTGELNRWFAEAIEKNPPPAPGGKRIKLRYITQIKTRPPSFVVFGNRVEDLPESYRRYLVNGIRTRFAFKGLPIRLTLRGGRNPFDR